MKQTTLSIDDLKLGDTIILENPAGQRLQGIVSDLSASSIKITLANGCSYLLIGGKLEGSFSFKFPAIVEK